LKAVFTSRETDIMTVLWEHGPATVTEVQERLTEPFAYNTVLTVLRTLESKGFVTPTKEGRAHRYRPRVAPNDARRSALRQVTDKLFRGSTDMLLTHMVSEQGLSKSELRRLRTLLDEKLAKGKS
jgi:predicted transcriptional regulator